MCTQNKIIHSNNLPSIFSYTVHASMYNASKTDNSSLQINSLEQTKHFVLTAMLISHTAGFMSAISTYTFKLPHLFFFWRHICTHDLNFASCSASDARGMLVILTRRAMPLPDNPAPHPLLPAISFFSLCISTLLVGTTKCPAFFCFQSSLFFYFFFCQMSFILNWNIPSSAFACVWLWPLLVLKSDWCWWTGMHATGVG